MKEALQVSLWCLFAALALNAAFTQVNGQMLAPTSAFDIPWLQIHATNNPGDKTIRPERTIIITSVRPLVQQVSAQPQRWQITFINQ
jgi:hypothetical protein